MTRLLKRGLSTYLRYFKVQYEPVVINALAQTACTFITHDKTRSLANLKSAVGYGHDFSLQAVYFQKKLKQSTLLMAYLTIHRDTSTAELIQLVNFLSLLAETDQR